MERWVVINKKADFSAIGEKFGIDPVTARLIRNRDIVENEDIRRYLQGGMADLYDPHLLKDAVHLVEILQDKIQKKLPIRIIGDYDIDGVMASYILKKALLRCGADVSVQIPDRKKDGYGLNRALIEQAKQDGMDTILTCDNGISALPEIAYAKSLSMTVLVTDHHELPFTEEEGQRRELRSEADAVVNPHRPDCPYPNKELCGAAVAWKIVCLLYEKTGIDPREAEEFLENAAFATVGDIMCLQGENRILVKEGLKRIHHTQNEGMKALITRCGLLPEQVGAYHFGYVLGPCINASGRLDTAKRALDLLLTEDPAEAGRAAEELVILNEERKAMTDRGVELAREVYEREGYDADPVAVIELPQTDESIAGIIAGRIREEYHKPVFILTQGEGCVKGSGRSIEAYSMYEELCRCGDLLLKFGGHPMAAGLSMQEEHVGELRRRLNENCRLTKEDLMPKIRIDVPMPVDYANLELVREFSLLAPFGKGNGQPVFADRDLRIARMWIVGKNKNVLRLKLVSSGGKPLQAIYFGNIDNFCDYFSRKFGKTEVELAMNGQENKILLSIVYAPKINVYRDCESLQFEIQYYR